MGHPTKVAWATGPTYQGPIRIRGRRLGARGEVLFESFDNRWRGEPVRRVDGANLMGELDFLESHSYFPNTPVGWRIWPTGTYVEAPGCHAWQVDGIGFTEVITMQV